MPHQNRLAGETSPYLRQHADNPVDWYPWGDAAFATARDRDVPILLSVGYSACHWCHVMAHESFEDADTAALMNELFVNVKVDREERPDVDAIYMDAVQAMTGQGGWPMTVFLTPAGKPFFGGTYFPSVGRGGMISFTELCRRIHEVWIERRSDIEGQADDLTAAVGQAATLAGGDRPPGDELLSNAVDQLERAFDPKWGGFGKGLVAPWPPVHRVVRMLEQVGAGGVLQAVHVPTVRCWPGGTNPRNPRNPRCASRPAAVPRGSLARPEGLCLLPRAHPGPPCGPGEGGYAAVVAVLPLWRRAAA